MRNTILFCLMLLWTTAQAQTGGTVDFSPGLLTFKKTGVYDQLVYEKGQYNSIPGYPRLPVIIQYYVLPVDAKVTELAITGELTEKIEGSFYLYPVQPPVPTDERVPPSFVEPLDSVYSLDVYPAQPAQIVSDGYHLGYHVVGIQINPVRYHPLTREVYIRNVSFTIRYTTGESPGKIISEKQSYNRAEFCRGAIRQMVQNKDDLSRFSSDVKEEEEALVSCSQDSAEFLNPSAESRSRNLPVSVMDRITPDYLIITNEALKPEFERLAEWKTKKGVPAKIKLVEEIERENAGMDLPEKIRNYLIKAKEKWGAGMFVLLGGDVEIVPARLVTKGNPYFASDVYYATTAGDWYLGNEFRGPENTTIIETTWLLGRLPVKTGSEARTLIEKIVRYEKAENIPDRNYFNNHGSAVAAMGYHTKMGGFYANYMRYIKQEAYDVNNITDPWLITDDHLCNLPDFGYGNGYAPCLGAPYAKGALSKENFRQMLNDSIPGKGHIHVLTHMDHSNPYTMGCSSEYRDESFSISEMDGLTNRNYPQIIFSTGCRPATFDVNCIAERYLNNPNGGGIAFVGNSYDGYWSEYLQINAFIDALYEDTDGTPFQYSIGTAYRKVTETHTSTCHRRLHLLGDPEMPVWTATPKNLTVAALASLLRARPGSIEISVNISGLATGEKAMICLSKGDEVYISKMAGNGESRITASPRTGGFIDVTVTAHNYLPFEKSLQVPQKAKSMKLTKLELTDDGTGESCGDGNGCADSGETVELTASVCNFSTKTIDNVSCKLTCDSRYIEITNPSVTLTTINAGDTVTLADKFKLNISKEAPETWPDEAKAIKLKLVLAAGDDSVLENFTLAVNQAEIRLRDRFDIRNSRGETTLIGGDTVRFGMKLFNAGNGSAKNVSVRLSGRPETVVVPDEAVAYGDIGAVKESANEIPFEIRLAESFKTGNPIPLAIHITDDYGHNWHESIDLNELRPVAPVAKLDSSFTFVATDNSILLKMSHTTGNRYNFYRGDERGTDIYRKLNSHEIKISQFKDVDLAPFSRYHYKFSTVSPTGLESALSNALEASVRCPLIEGFPVVYDGTNFIHYDHINSADVNQDGYRELMSSISSRDGLSFGFLAGIDHKATDLYDADNDKNTHQGIARVEASVQAAPAIGDLDGDGKPEVVNVTRSNQSPGETPRNFLNCYSMRDEDGDGKPDLLWQQTIPANCDKAPILSDLDGDGTLEIILNGDYLTPGLRIYSYTGEFWMHLNTGYLLGIAAVAELDNDGGKEIIAGDKNGVHIWRIDGTPFSENPVFTRPYHVFDTSVTVCDLDGDSKKEILTAAIDTLSASKGNRKSPVYAFKPNGHTLPGWNGENYSRYDNSWHNMHTISVSDMDRDGMVEVACLGKDYLRIWGYDGKLKMEKFMNFTEIDKICPILADVDGDDMAEAVIVGGKKQYKVWAYKLDGSLAFGFPLASNDEIKTTPCMTDMDNDGSYEMAVGSLNGVYAWNTLGKPSSLDWVSARGNAQNTGEYQFCRTTSIRGYRTWEDYTELCGDVVVESGCLTLMPGCTFVMGEGATLTVKPGAQLLVMGGRILNADIRVEAYGTITLQAAGSVKLRPGCLLRVEKNGIFQLRPDAAVYPK